MFIRIRVYLGFSHYSLCDNVFRDILLKVILNYDLKVVHGTRESEFYSYFSVFQIPNQLGPTDIEERHWHENEKNTFTAISGDTFSKCANFS